MITHLIIVNVEAVVAVELAVKVFHFTLDLAGVGRETHAMSRVAYCAVLFKLEDAFIIFNS